MKGVLNWGLIEVCQTGVKIALYPFALRKRRVKRIRATYHCLSLLPSGKVFRAQITNFLAFLPFSAISVEYEQGNSWRRCPVLLCWGNRWAKTHASYSFLRNCVNLVQFDLNEVQSIRNKTWRTKKSVDSLTGSVARFCGSPSYCPSYGLSFTISYFRPATFFAVESCGAVSCGTLFYLAALLHKLIVTRWAVTCR